MANIEQLRRFEQRDSQAVAPLGRDARGLKTSEQFDKAAFIKRLRKLRASMPMTTATVEIMRREDRY